MRLRTVIFLLGLATGAGHAPAQSYPVKPVRMISTQQAGQGGDIVVRLMGPKMSEALGQPIVIESISGANGAIATEAVIRSAPDGYTLLFTSPSATITALFLVANLRYDPVRDLVPISASAEPATVIVTALGVPAANLAELIAYAKRNPGKLSYGTFGVGSVFHFVGASFNSAAGIDIVHVPYKGMSPIINDLMGNRIEVTYIPLGQALPLRGKLRILGLLEADRYKPHPEIPTVRETLPGFEKPPSWFGYFGPAGIPAPAVSRLNAEMVKAVQASEVRAKLEDAAMGIIGNSPEQFAALMRRGVEVYGAAVKAAGLKPE